MAPILPQARPLTAPIAEAQATSGAVGAVARLSWARGAAGASGPVLVALAACLTCWGAGWRGTDWAAQIYRAAEVGRHGLAVWDPGWYGGDFPLNYSLLFPLAAGWLGLWPVSAASAAGAAYSFDRLVSTRLGGRPLASWYFALSTAVPIAIGQLPTLAGEALGLGCICWVSSRRRWAASAGVVLGLASALTSPVTGSFTALALVGWGLAGVRRGLAGASGQAMQALAKVAAGAAVLGASAALPLLFPVPGYFPFIGSDLVVVVVVSSLLALPWLDAPVAVRAVALLYAAVSISLFVVATPMGDNDARFAAYIGVPLAILYLLRRARALRLGLRLGAVALTAALAVWEWAPMSEALDAADNGLPSSAPYYAPLLARLHELSHGLPVRVEVPPLAHHWESAYLAPSFPLARGWERQLDMAYDPLFYRGGALRGAEYLAWLRENGVSYVALADAPLDYAAAREAALLRSGRVAGLRLIWRSRGWELWKVNGSPGLAEAPATVTALGPSEARLYFSMPGTATVRLRWTPYWSLVLGAKLACLSRAPGGWTEVRSRSAGTLLLRVSLLGAVHGHCSAGTLPYDQRVDSR
jgi:hypothetical protein